MLCHYLTIVMCVQFFTAFVVSLLESGKREFSWLKNMSSVRWESIEKDTMFMTEADTGIADMALMTIQHQEYRSARWDRARKMFKIHLKELFFHISRVCKSHN